MYTLVIVSDPSAGFGCTVSHSREGKTEGCAYLVMLVAGEGTEEDLTGTWRSGSDSRSSLPREENARAAGRRMGLGLAAAGRAMEREKRRATAAI